MKTISKSALSAINGEYQPLTTAFRNGGRMAFFYGAESALLITVGAKSWPIPIDKRRIDRPIKEAIIAILQETKVGTKIIRHAERYHARMNDDRQQLAKKQANAEMITELAIQLRKPVPVTFK